MALKTLIAECTVYDFKLMLEEKKPKSLSAMGNDTLNIWYVLLSNPLTPIHLIDYNIVLG